MSAVKAVEARALCIIGVAQETTYPPGPAPEPLVSWERVARAAAADARTPDLLRKVDSVQVVYCQTWPYDDPVGRLCAALGSSPRHRVYSGIGGTTPQVLLNRTAEAMLNGELDSALIVGGEALATLRAAKRAGERLRWSHRESPRRPFPWPDMHPSETNHRVLQAWETFPIWDTARRAARGDRIEDYLAANAAMTAALSRVAAGNPYAWRREVRTAEEVQDTGNGNRYVGWPYTKAEVANIDVDQSAAVLVVTHERADHLGIPEDGRVYLNGWAYAEDPPELAARADLGASAAMRLAGRAALEAAGITIADLTAIDFYSCFPSALNLACDAYGIAPASRDLTVTGGLPFAGGPANGYVLHSVAATVERLRRGGGHGLVTGIGMSMVKHVTGVYGTSPTSSPGRDVQADVDAAQPRRPVLASYEGPATVAAYTVAHRRDNSPEIGLVVLDTDRGRAIARVHDESLLAEAEREELVGRPVKVTTDGTANTAQW